MRSIFCTAKTAKMYRFNAVRAETGKKKRRSIFYKAEKAQKMDLPLLEQKLEKQMHSFFC